jgi:hypothetical protein
MSKMMIYAALSATGGNIENVYGHKMRVRVIDSDDKDAKEQAKADGWQPKADAVIEQIEAKKLQAENETMKGELADGGDKERTKELEAEVKELKSKLAIYEETKDVNGDGVVSYDEHNKDELKALLDDRGVEYVERDSKDTLIQKLKDSE